MHSEKSDKSSEVRKMGRQTTVTEASLLLREIAGSRAAGETIKGVLRRLHRKLVDWSPGRIRDVWYADVRVRLRAEEVEQLRALVQPRDVGTDDELIELRTRIARLEALLEAASSPLDR